MPGPRALFAVMLPLLLAQFLLGMVVNLFVEVPERHPGAHPADYFTGSAQSVGWALARGAPWLQVHAALGTLLVVTALFVLIRALVARAGAAVGASALGLTGVLGGAFNGASFLVYHEDVSSMFVAGGFALAVAGYAWGLSATSRSRSRQPA